MRAGSFQLIWVLLAIVIQLKRNDQKDWVQGLCLKDKMHCKNQYACLKNNPEALWNYINVWARHRSGIWVKSISAIRIMQRLNNKGFFQWTGNEKTYSSIDVFLRNRNIIYSPKLNFCATCG